MVEKKSIKIKLISISIFIIILVIAIVSAVYMKNNNNTSDEILYSTTYYFEFGSRSTRIYINGDVYDDLEIENPNHEPSFKYLKTLSKDELDNLKSKINNESDNEIIKDYIIQLVYSVKKFDNFGRY